MKILTTALILTAAMATAARAGTWNSVSWVDDSSVNSVITAGTYTAAADVTSTTIAGTGATTGGPTINGVTFESMGYDGGSTFSGTGYNFTYGFVSAGNFAAPLASTPSAPETTALSTGLLFGGSGYTLSLTGLTVGQSYQFSFFSPVWSDGNRNATLTFDDTGASYLMNQSSSGGINQILTYDYIATSTTQNMTLAIDTSFGQSGTHTFAFANEVAAVPEPGTYALMLAGFAMLFGMRRWRSTGI